jgi:AI-2 transport protein TqsA
VVVIIGGLKLAAPLVVPFLLAVVLATILIPPLHWLTAHRLPLPLAMLVLSLGLVLIWVPLAAIVGASFDDFYVALPGYQEKIQAMVGGGRAPGWVSTASRRVATHRGPGQAGRRAVLRAPDRRRARLGLANIFLILLTIIFILRRGLGFSRKDSRARSADRAEAWSVHSGSFPTGCRST